jgi:hypothetical protein
MALEKCGCRNFLFFLPLENPEAPKNSFFRVWKILKPEKTVFFASETRQAQKKLFFDA